MTTYYCIKETREIIGTHKAWLELRANDPARYAELSNKNPSRLQLVRIGYHMRDSLATIDDYGLLDKHKALCLEYMRREVADVQARIDTLQGDLTLSLSRYAHGLLDYDLNALQQRRDTWQADINRGALRLSSCGED